MRKTSLNACFRMASVALLASVLLAGEVVQASKTEVPRSSPSYSAGWVCLPPSAGGGATNSITISALPTVLGTHGSEVATPQEAIKQFGYDPANVRRTFSLEKTTFLLGEPLLVKFSVELHGDGKWDISDWDFYNNRDETFIIIMRGKDGRWVPDRYPPSKFGYNLGGFQPGGTFDRSTPEIHWLPVQQYCGITDVGEYELFCMKWNTRLRRQKSYPVSPLLAELPPDLVAEVRNRPIVNIDGVTDYAHFKISIGQGG